VRQSQCLKPRNAIRTRVSPKASSTVIPHKLCMYTTLSTSDTPLHNPTHMLSPLTPAIRPPRNLQHHIPNRTNHPQRNQRPPYPPTQHPFIQRHKNQQAHKRNQQRRPTDDQRGTNIDMIRPELNRIIRMFRMPLLTSPDQDV